MPPHLGIFLDYSHRMHPEICAYVSEVFYDNRLEPFPDCERQVIGGIGPLSGSGLRWLPIEHSGNRTSSMEEAEAVQRILDELIGRGWIDRHGNEHTLDLADVLVVAPYNAQVTLLGHVLPPGIDIGTVDRFQGRRAPSCHSFSDCVEGRRYTRRVRVSLQQESP